MICPNCGAVVADGALRCPRCRFELGVTQKISLREATWCPSCGALCPPGATSCPKCGSDLSRPVTGRSTRDLKLPEIGNTSAMYALTEKDLDNVKIESAIPNAGEGAGAAQERVVRPRAFAVAALAALLVVGGGILLLTHPWDPNASNISATTPADTSLSGYPGRVESLTGQDDVQAGQGQTAADVLKAYHESLGELLARSDELDEALSVEGVSTDAQTRQGKADEMEALALDVSNLISEISSYSGGQSYPDATNDLLTLGSWLRNRCDALSRAWERSVSSDDPKADEDAILALASEGDSYRQLFSDAYGSWSVEANS